MKNQFITLIEQDMLNILDNMQLEQLHNSLTKHLSNVEIIEQTIEPKSYDFDTVLDSFIAAKRVEGCSLKTIKLYYQTISKVMKNINKDIRITTTDDLRVYLDNYASQSKATKVTIDNVRRILSSFFNWLEEENFILKSPAKRIHKVRSGKTVKAVYSDEMIETLRDACENRRDLAIVDLLISSGIRVGELVHLNIDDINFEKRECIVLGKGNKERKVYFDAKTKLHILNYLKTRHDDNPALFITLNSPIRRLNIAGVEIMIRKLGKANNIKSHPHKFRRTFATRAIGKGMPVEQVQHLLGHKSLDTTMEYAMVQENNVKLSHQKFIS